LSPKVAEGALAHARHRQAARIFCGHTHAALHKHEHGINYFNCGAWIDEHPTYITVGEEGVQIHEYVDGPDGHRPGKDNDEERRWDNSELTEFASGEGLLEDGEYEPVGL
jgi:hypothetical protein